MKMIVKARPKLHQAGVAAVRALLGALLVLAPLNCSPQVAGPKPDALEDGPWENVDVAEFNGKVAGAAAAGEIWASNPTLVALRRLDNDTVVKSLSLTQSAEAAEEIDALDVSIMRDGLLDDSVRGDRHRFKLQRQDDGSWRIVQAQWSWRCWRGEGDSYTVEPCP